MIKLTLLFLTLNLYAFTQETKVFSVYFEPNSHILTLEQQNSLSNFKAKNPRAQWQKINGFTDSIGTNESNLILASKRIQNVLLFFPEATLEQNIIGENLAENKIKLNSEMRRVDLIYVLQAEIVKVVPIEKPLPIIEKKQASTYETYVETNKVAIEKKFKTVTNTKSMDLNVQFYGGSSELLPESLPELVGFSAFLKENETIKILIRGHVCCMDDYPLSVDRAKAIYDYLINAGIESTRLDYKGYSNKMPKIADEVNDYARQQNRRVDIVLIP